MSFLRDYLDYATANEAPYMFHVWGAYLCISATIGRQVWFVADDGFLYPHLYILYVGKAGNGKGEAMGKVKRVLARVGTVSMSGNVETPEGFIRFICGNPKATPPVESKVLKIVTGPRGVLEETTPITIFATEFVNFIAMSPEGWMNFLNDVWDADVNYHYRTKNSGEDIIPGPSVNVLGALTTTVAADLQKQRIIGTGLGRRTIFQFGERQWNNPVPRRIMTPERVASFEKAAAALAKIGKVSGLMSNTPEANEWWDEWYCENLRATPEKSFNIQSWFASKPDIVIKLAMLTALSEGEMTIGIPHYTVVLDYLELLEEDLPKIFGGVGRNELADISIKIHEFLSARSSPVSRRELKTNFFSMCKTVEEFDECIRFLKESRQLVEGLMTVKGVSEVVVSTPEVMSAFALSHAITFQPADATPTLTSQDIADAAGPSSEQPTPPQTPLPSPPTAVPPAVEIAVLPVPSAQTKGD